MSKENIKGFTLVELLVVISIIALLLSILMPVLSVAKEQAKRVYCGSNLKNIGSGIFMYVNSNDERLPEPLYAGNVQGIPAHYRLPYNSYLAYHINQRDVGTPDFIVGDPFNLGYLHKTDIIQKPKIFYCPSAYKGSAGTSHDTVSYHYDDYIDEGGMWPWNRQAYNSHVVRIGYNYIPQCRKKKDDYGFPAVAKKATELAPDISMCSGLIKDLTSIPHKKGFKKGRGLNMLFGDCSVNFKNNKEAFADNLWEQPPNGNSYNFRMIIRLLEEKPLPKLW